MLFFMRILLLVLAGMLLASALALSASREGPGPSLIAYTSVRDQYSLIITWPGDEARRWSIALDEDGLWPQWSPTCGPSSRIPRCQLAFVAVEAGYLASFGRLYTTGLNHELPHLVGELNPQSWLSSWSPDGEWISFETEKGASSEIYAARTAGGLWHNISNHPAYDFTPHWSPDGRKIAFISYRNRPPISNSEVYVATLDDQQQVVDLRRLTQNSARDTLAGWSPDSQWVLFTSDWPPDVEPELWIARIDGSESRKLTDHPASDTAPVWSPDGQWIAFVSGRGGNTEIYLVRPDGSGLRNLSQHPARDFRPVWSPDSQWIAFESSRTGHLEIFVTRIDGSGLRNLSNNPDADFNPLWSPDGRWLSFESMRTGDREIFAVRPDGSDLRNLSNYLGVDTTAAWSPALEFPWRPVPLVIAAVVLIGIVWAIRRKGTQPL